MQGPDKTRLVIGERSLLDRAVDAVGGAETVVVVGPQRETARDVTWTLEDPPGGGPAAALAAGLAAVTAPQVVVLAADLPFVTGAHVEELLTALSGDGVVVIDDGGREQWLFSAWRTEVLRVTSLEPGRALRDVLGAVTPAKLRLTRGGSMPWFDCDTPEDVRRAEEML